MLAVEAAGSFLKAFEVLAYNDISRVTSVRAQTDKTDETDTDAPYRPLNIIIQSLPPIADDASSRTINIHILRAMHASSYMGNVFVIAPLRLESIALACSMFLRTPERSPCDAVLMKDLTGALAARVATCSTSIEDTLCLDTIPLDAEFKCIYAPIDSLPW